ncbi:hypothetical protein GCM10009125_05520 [Castellaniella daejeonensis]|uniref:ESPR domain-containing protein n=1 Tax=Castellaniella daejeonensis TaxID=659013 RepID=A0ABN0TE92_9BURK
MPDAAVAARGAATRAAAMARAESERARVTWVLFMSVFLSVFPAAPRWSRDGDRLRADCGAKMGKS